MNIIFRQLQSPSSVLPFEARHYSICQSLTYGAAMSTNVHLTPELESFARACVDEGRFNNVSEVVRQGLRLLQESEERRQHFNAMLKAAEAEADREGSFALDDVLAEADAIIAANKK